MKFFIRLQFTAFLLILFLSSLAFADRQTGIAIRIIGKDAANVSDTVYCGYGNPMGVLSYGLDADTIDLPQYGVSVMETALPPLPPTGYFDLRFIDSRSGFMLDQGIKNNFHQGTFFSHQDTFKISFQSSDTINQNHPGVISWDLPSAWGNQKAGGYAIPRIQYEDPDLGLIKINMIENSSLTFTKNEIKSFLIIITIIPVDLDIVIDDNIPSSFTLHQNYPNPFNPTTMINYTIPVASIVTLKIYNSLGEEVTTLVNTKQEPGFKSVEWNANNLASSLFLYRITTSTGFSSTKKMLLVR